MSLRYGCLARCEIEVNRISPLTRWPPASKGASRGRRHPTDSAGSLSARVWSRQFMRFDADARGAPERFEPPRGAGMARGQSSQSKVVSGKLEPGMFISPRRGILLPRFRVAAAHD